MDHFVRTPRNPPHRLSFPIFWETSAHGRRNDSVCHLYWPPLPLSAEVWGQMCLVCSSFVCCWYLSSGYQYRRISSGAVSIALLWSHTTYCNHICTYVCTCSFLYREVTVAFLFCARACISGASQILYVYTAEVYPTEVRGLGLGIASAVGSGGSIFMPYIAQVRMHVAIT